jgi:uncharacterized protein
MTNGKICFPDGFLESFSRRNHISKVSLFGSVLRKDFRPDSDVDVLVEFEAGKTPSLFDIVDLEIELGKALGRKVDIRTPNGIGRFMRPRILREAATQYAARG